MTTYTYVFGGIIANRYLPITPVVSVITNRMLVPFGLVGDLTNKLTLVTNYAGPSGDFYILSPAWCYFKSNSLVSTFVNTVTNQLDSTNIVGPDLGQHYSETSRSSFTNITFLGTPYICSTAPPSPTLRRGIEHVQFVRANFDSLLGQFFQPLTNVYTMTVITNSQQVTEIYQRAVFAPDILLSAQDLATSPSDGIIGNSRAARGIVFDASQILSGLEGPGTIHGPTTFIYNKVGPAFLNGPFLNTNAFLFNSILISTVNEFSQSINTLQWASFNTDTNSIILYPNGTSLANLANSLYIQVTPAAAVDGNVGSYYAQQFDATGGQPPYTWSAPDLSSVAPFFSFNVGTRTIFGTPNMTGTFNFIIRLTDSVNRTADYNYSITIH